MRDFVGIPQSLTPLPKLKNESDPFTRNFNKLDPDAVIELRACNSGTKDRVRPTSNNKSIAEALNQHTGNPVIGFETPSPHYGFGLNFSSSNAPYNPRPNELTPSSGPLYLVPQSGAGHNQVVVQ